MTFANREVSRAHNDLVNASYLLLPPADLTVRTFFVVEKLPPSRSPVPQVSDSDG